MVYDVNEAPLYGSCLTYAVFSSADDWYLIVTYSIISVNNEIYLAYLSYVYTFYTTNHSNIS